MSRINITAHDASYKMWYWDNESMRWVDTAESATNFPDSHTAYCAHSRVNAHESRQDLADRMISIHTSEVK